MGALVAYLNNACGLSLKFSDKSKTYPAAANKCSVSEPIFVPLASKCTPFNMLGTEADI